MSTRDTRGRCKLETNIYYECHTRRQRKLDLRAANARKIRGERWRVDTCQGGEDHIVVFRYTRHDVSEEDACGGIEYGCREEQDLYRTKLDSPAAGRVSERGEEVRGNPTYWRTYTDISTSTEATPTRTTNIGLVRRQRARIEA